MSVQKRQRNISMDVIRCAALFLVVLLHFFYRNGYGAQFMRGKIMYVVAVCRNFCVSCVPLFLMLSGYLMCNKQLSRRYYKGIIKTYSVYVLANFAYLVYELLVKGIPFSVSKLIFGILDFSILEYCWYVEMYIGLFLLIPFLNIIYNNLDTQKKKQWLLVTFLFMAAIPAVLNIHNFTVKGWWLKPTLSTEYQALVPDGWTALGAISYYFIGCYLREYPLKISKTVNVILLGISTIFLGSYDYFRSYGYCHTPGLWQDNDSLFVVVVAVLLFNFLASIDFSGLPEWTKKMLQKTSDLCFGGYLVSCIFDEIMYGMLTTKYGDSGLIPRLKWIVVLVPLIYVCSLLLSLLLNAIYQSLCSFFAYLSKGKEKW